MASMKLFLAIVALIATTAYGAVTPSGHVAFANTVYYYNSNTAPAFTLAGTSCNCRLRGSKKSMSPIPGDYATYVAGSLNDNDDTDLEGYGFHWQSCAAGAVTMTLPDGYWMYSVDCGSAPGAVNVPFKIDTVAPISAVTASADYDPSPSDRTTYGFTISSTDYHGTTAMLAGVTALPNPAYDSTQAVTTASEVALIHYQYKLDNGNNWKSVTGNSFTLSAQAAGAHCVEIRAIDLLGNREAFPAVYCWTVETYTKETGCTFSYSTNGASYATTIASSVSLSDLPDGTNTFTIMADDMYGNPTDSSGLNTFSWTIDTSKPVASFATSGTWGETEVVTSTKGTFKYTSSETSSFFKYAIDSGASVLALTTTTQVFPSGTFAASSCSGSAHTFAVNAIDAVGNIGESTTDSFTVEPINTVLTVSNAVSVSAVPVVNGGTAVFAISAIVDETAPTSYSYEYRVDGGSWMKGKHFPRFGVRGLADGAHTITARATTTGGCNDPTPVTVAFAIDTSAPVTTLNCPVSPSNAMDLTVYGYVDDLSVSGAGTQYKLGMMGTYSSPGVPVVPCADCAANTFAIQLEDLVEGSYTLFAKSTDRAGLTGEEASCTWVVDMGPPETMVLQGPPTPQLHGEEASFKFGCMETSCVFMYSVDGTGYTMSEDDMVSLGDLPEGVHTIQVYAIDAAGNADPTPAGYTWTIYADEMYSGYCSTCSFTYNGATPKAFEPISSKTLHGVSGPDPIVDPYADREL